MRRDPDHQVEMVVPMLRRGHRAQRHALRPLVHDEAVERDVRSERVGVDPRATPQSLPHRVVPETLDEALARYSESLTAYQSPAYARRFEERIASLRAAATGPAAERLVATAARNLYRLMAVKDEYEVARLYSDGGFREQLASQFESYDRLDFHLAPPMLNRIDARTGRPEKHAFGSWMRHLFPLLAKLRGLRGGLFDVFGYTAERRSERALLGEYEATLDRIARTLTADRVEAAAALAAWPERVKGYGPVRAKNTEAAQAEEERLRAEYDGASAPLIPMAAE